MPQFNVKPCRYCEVDVPLEYDPEYGTYYAPDYHFACLGLPGNYYVVSYLDGQIYQHPATGEVEQRSFRYYNRAQEVAAHHASWNRQRWSFHVVAQIPGLPDNCKVLTDVYVGTLAETKPDGTPFYGTVVPAFEKEWHKNEI